MRWCGADKRGSHQRSQHCSRVDVSGDAQASIGRDTKYPVATSVRIMVASRGCLGGARSEWVREQRNRLRHIGTRRNHVPGSGVQNAPRPIHPVRRFPYCYGCLLSMAPRRRRRPPWTIGLRPRGKRYFARRQTNSYSLDPTRTVSGRNRSIPTTRSSHPGDAVRDRSGRLDPKLLRSVAFAARPRRAGHLRRMRTLFQKCSGAGTSSATPTSPHCFTSGWPPAFAR
jgi:hypothetical protein